MIVISHFFVAFTASVVGAISGIGGGIIIKPLLDSIGAFDISAITFLSSCTVLSMSFLSIFLNKRKGISLNIKIGGFLSIGSIFGGIAGKYLFNICLVNVRSIDSIKTIQSIILIVLSFGVIIFTLNKKRINPLKLKNGLLSIFIGFILGITGSFLGIGGGPINLFVLYFFFAMKPKAAAINSLFIIFFSQLSSLLITISSDTMPEFKVSVLVFMIIGGISGALTGLSILKRISEKSVDKLFVIVLMIIIVICIKNIYI